MSVEPVKVQAHFKEDGTIEPLKFIYKDKTYHVGSLENTELNKWAGNKLMIFSYKAGKTSYLLRYELDTMKWTIKFI